MPDFVLALSSMGH
uniref:Uncharacterized protein n=1 Tax=Rhizophora mucronata TaxID=61149 RepID=A0A2P2P5M6_RHIMU